MKLLIITLLFVSLPCDAQWYQKEFDVMGTKAKVELESDKPELAQKLILKVIEEMNRIDRLMSPFKPSSELSKINNLAASQEIKISKEMFQLLQRSIDYSELTGGAFDITFPSVGFNYDYRNNIRPTGSQLKELVNNINYKSILLNANKTSIKFKSKQTKIDLGGIAKGHAVDKCIEILVSNGIKNAFVNAGGDSRVIGKKKDRMWYIGVRDPRDEKKLIVNLPLEDVAISTSGDYERFFIQDNVRYHHILDPKTGDSARKSQSVTIIASNGIDADALSTSIFILGSEDGLKLINQMPDVSAIIIDKDGQMKYSDDLLSVN